MATGDIGDLTTEIIKPCDYGVVFQLPAVPLHVNLAGQNSPADEPCAGADVDQDDACLHTTVRKLIK